MTNIVLADDQPMIRYGLKTMLESEHGWQVVGETGDSTAVVDLVIQTQPEVLILDVMMPGANGIETIQMLRNQVAGLKIVVFSVYINDTYVRTTFHRGAVAYVQKDADPEELTLAVREVLTGRRYLSRFLAERAIDVYLQHDIDDNLDWTELLTPRERQVLQLAAQGVSIIDIGARLSISPRTAETHRANLMRKLGLRSHGDLMRYAMNHGIIPFREEE